MNTADLKVGDEAYFQAQVRYMNSQTVAVTKVGRKWIELSNGCRVEKGHRYVDNRGVGASSGVIWASEAEWQAYNTREKRYCAVRDKIRDIWRMPNYITDQNLDDLERIFQINAQGS